MKKGANELANSNSRVKIQGIKKQKKIEKFLPFKPSKRCGHEAVIQGNSDTGKGVTVNSSTKPWKKYCSNP